MKPVRAFTLSCVGFLLLGGSALGADIAPVVSPETHQVTTEDGWEFTIAPYFWAAGLSGDTGLFGLPTVDIDADFGDIWDHLDFAAMAVGEARYGPYSIFADVLYTKLSGSTGTPRGILASEGSVDTETFAGTLGAGYTLLEDSQGKLDIVAGARIWSVDTTVSVSGGLLDSRSRSDGDTWVDALAGFKANYFVTPTVYLAGWGLVGRGGADIDWDVAATVGYKFNDTVSSVIGYRALGVDYSNDGFVFNVVQQGPILGLVVNF